jgi:hypothetical protein
MSGFRRVVRALRRADEAEGHTAVAEITPEAWDFFLALYLTPGQGSVPHCYRLLKDVAAEHGWEVASQRTFERRVQNLNLRVKKLKREGEGKGALLEQTTLPPAATEPEGLNPLWLELEAQIAAARKAQRELNEWVEMTGGRPREIHAYRVRAAAERAAYVAADLSDAVVREHKAYLADLFEGGEA